MTRALAGQLDLFTYQDDHDDDRPDLITALQNAAAASGLVRTALVRVREGRAHGRPGSTRELAVELGGVLPFPPASVTSTSWMSVGHCVGDDVPDDWHGGDTMAARRVCAGCPVRERCADWAAATGEEWGVWGGLGPDALRERREAAGWVLGAHGTAAGFWKGCRCKPCKDARAADKTRKAREASFGPGGGDGRAHTPAGTVTVGPWTTGPEDDDGDLLL